MTYENMEKEPVFGEATYDISGLPGVYTEGFDAETNRAEPSYHAEHRNRVLKLIKRQENGYCNRGIRVYTIAIDGKIETRVKIPNMII